MLELLRLGDIKETVRGWGLIRCLVAAVILVLAVVDPVASYVVIVQLGLQPKR